MKKFRPNLIGIIVLVLAAVSILFVTRIYLRRAVCGRFISTQDRDLSRKARLDAIASVLEASKQKNGRYPQALSGKGKLSAIQNLGWGGLVEYSVSLGGRSYQLIDIGKDRVSGTADDIILSGRVEDLVK